MVKFTKEWNLSRIKEIIEDDYSKEQKEVIKSFYGYIKEANFSLERQKTKLIQVNKLFKHLGNRKLSNITKEEIYLYSDNSKFNQTKIELDHFFDWYKNNISIRSYKEVKKETRSRLISNLLNYNKFNDNQREIMQRYHTQLKKWGVALESERGYLQQAKMLMLALNKDLEKLTQEDIDNYVSNLDQKYKPKTNFERRMFLRNFLSWYSGVEKEDYPLTKGLTLKRPKDSICSEDILKPEEVLKMIQIADNFRDKCIIIMLYESASRKGEFLQAKIKNVDLSNKEYVLFHIPEGKTVSRTVALIDSVPYLTQWINSHPDRDNREAPLFPNQGAWLGRAMGEDGLKRILKISGRKAGIKKRIYPHLLRHSKLTELGKVLKEPEMRLYAGWSKESKMPSVYIHLNNNDVNDKILINAGLKSADPKNNTAEIFKAVTCPRCDFVNSPDNKYCKCGFILDLKAVNELLEERSNSEAKISNFIENEPVQKLFKMMEMLQTQLEEIKNK
jgi:integrase/recombinase XerD